MTEEKIFADGMWFQGPGPKAPQFVKGKISVKVDAFIAFLQAHASKSGWVNLDLKESRKGVLYLELNTWQKGDAPRARRQERQEDRSVQYDEEGPSAPEDGGVNTEDTPF